MRDASIHPGLIEPNEHDVPPGWTKVRLGEVASFVGGGRLRVTKSNDYRVAGYPAYSAAGQDGFVSVWEFERNAVVVPSIGSIGCAYRAEGRWTTLANTQVVFPNERVLDNAFLHHRVHDTKYWPVSGTAQPFIKPSDLPKCWIKLPKLSEQRRIAEILDTVDDAILKTEQVIAKLEQMKQGLLHDLLTRGVDDNGELRDPERHPELFKDSIRGPIPCDWSLRLLPSMFVKVCPGPRIDQRGCVANGRTPVLDQSEDGFIGYSDEEPGVCASPELPVVTFANHTCAVRWITFACSAIQNVFFMRAANGIDDRFLFYVVSGRISQQAYQGHWPLLQKAVIPVPPYDEQKRIVSILDASETRMLNERREIAKLSALKLGLMNDLLTGRVRVKVPEATTT